jgi:hypothetical protein
VDWRRASKNAHSRIGYKGDPKPVDLWEHVNEKPLVEMTTNLADTHCLRLKDPS